MRGSRLSACASFRSERTGSCARPGSWSFWPPSFQGFPCESTDLTWRLIQYIGEHFQEPLSLEGLARELHVNKFYLSHTFSRKLQMNFREYLNHIRLDHARRLIRSTSRPMTEIWAEAGFESQRSFNRVFREVEGMTPGQYRKAPDGR